LTEYDTPAFVIKLKSVSEKKLAQVTAANLTKSLGLVIKGVLILMPYIQEPIDGEFLLRTNKTLDEAMEIKKFVDKKIDASKR
jgi:preprotein translocase subunit SecD